MIHLGDFPASHTAVCIPFDSFAAATGASSATSNFVAGDILVYKDGGTTQRTSANGITVSTSFDSQTGLQMVVIDLSDNSDAGFYATGHEFQVGVADITIDGQTVRAWLGTFSIERAGGILALLKGANGVAAIKTDTAAVKVQTDKLAFTVTNQVDANVLDWKSATAPAMTGDAFARLGAPAGASVSADIAATKVDTAAIKVQTDKLTFTVANQVDSNVLDWKSSTAPAMTGDAFARLGAPAGASVSADVAAVKVDTAAVKVQTDKLTFTVANQVDSNVKSNAGTAITAAAGVQEVKVASIANNAVTAASAAADLTTELQTGLATATALTSAQSDITAIKAKTDNLPTAPADETLVIVATTAIYNRLGAPAGASLAADIAGIQSDTDNIQTRIPAALTGAGNMKSDAIALNGDTTSAGNIAKTTRAIGRGTVTSGASATSIPTSAFTPAGGVADQFKGRIVTFDADTTTVALRGQSTDITASTNAAAPTFTVSALTTTPASGDTFSVT